MSTDNESSTDFSKASTIAVEDAFEPKNSNSHEETAHIPKFCDVICRKQFLGGYRNKLTGVIYHHAATQTIKSPWNYIRKEQFSRDSQTIETKDETQQTSKDAFTQVQVRNILIQTTNDKFTQPSEAYISADEIQTEYLAKVIFIQRYVRRWLAQRELKRRQQDLLDKQLWEEQQRKLREKQDSDFIKDIQRRKLHPIKEDDFLLLFSDLQNWWKNEAEIILKTKTGSEQQQALHELVKEEAKKISDIDKIKINVENRKIFHQRQKNLFEAGKPKMWKAYKKEIPVITETTQKAKTLHDLYMTISMKYISTQDRIDALQSLIQLLQIISVLQFNKTMKNKLLYTNYLYVLASLKPFPRQMRRFYRMQDLQFNDLICHHSCFSHSPSQPHNNNLTNMLHQLVQREIDLLLRGTKAKNLVGLRSRIQDLFWQCVKEPMFNPEIHSLSSLKKEGRKDSFILRCASCKQFFALPSDTVKEETGKGVMGNCFMKCKKCLYLENEGWIRKDVELYKKILKLLIAEEEKKPLISSIIYILQPCDIKHLVEAIWKRQSCLSGATDEKELELVRYNAEDCWTPWNCMLVTREEAAILSGIPNPKESYDDQFKKFVYQRHIAARNYFARIPRFLPYIIKSTINKDYDSSSEEDI